MTVFLCCSVACALCIGGALFCFFFFWAGGCSFVLFSVFLFGVYAPVFGFWCCLFRWARGLLGFLSFRLFLPVQFVISFGWFCLFFGSVFILAADPRSRFYLFFFSTLLFRPAPLVVRFPALWFVLLALVPATVSGGLAPRRFPALGWFSLRFSSAVVGLFLLQVCAFSAWALTGARYALFALLCLLVGCVARWWTRSGRTSVRC